MKRPVDRDDVNIIVQITILFAFAVLGLVGTAAALGLAWAVFRAVGGL